MNPRTFWIVLASAGLLIFCAWLRTGSSPTPKDPVYVCVETRKVLIGPPQPTPAVNPQTGRRTLMPGLYCQRCRMWYPALPLDLLQQNLGTIRCPKTGALLSPEGPRPVP